MSERESVRLFLRLSISMYVCLVWRGFLLSCTKWLTGLNHPFFRTHTRVAMDLCIHALHPASFCEWPAANYWQHPTLWKPQFSFSFTMRHHASDQRDTTSSDTEENLTNDGGAWGESIVEAANCSDIINFRLWFFVDSSLPLQPWGGVQLPNNLWTCSRGRQRKHASGFYCRVSGNLFIAWGLCGLLNVRRPQS